MVNNINVCIYKHVKTVNIYLLLDTITEDIKRFFLKETLLLNSYTKYTL